MSDDLLRDLQKLSGAIDRHQGGGGPQSSSTSRPPPQQQRHHTYVNPNYKPPQRTTFKPPVTSSPLVPYPSHSVSKELTIGGIAFKASKNKLTRKDAPPITSKPISSSYSRAHSSTSQWAKPRPPMSKPFYPSHRGAYKPRGARGGRNKVLKANGRQMKARKLDKQCPFFTKTGICNRGTKCLYRHDPDKIAICPQYLRGACPYSSETCQLSHEATPNRAPLCIHFANSGRCKNGDACVYPHFKVAPRTGVCKDFAVLGYCDKGIDCDKQHLKECPAFAETGACHNKKCKLPHVIRANATRYKKTEGSTSEKEVKPSRYGISFSTMAPEDSTENTQEAEAISISTQNDADYIPLTFEESDEQSYSEGEEVEREGGEEEEEEEAAFPDSTN